MELYEELRTDLQEIKKALTPIGDNPDPERKEKPDIECPVEEWPRTRRFKAFSWQGYINRTRKATERHTEDDRREIRA